MCPASSDDGPPHYKFCYSEFVGYYQDTVGNYFVIQNINIANKEVYIRPEMLSQDDDPNCSVFHRPHPPVNLFLMALCQRFLMTFGLVKVKLLTILADLLYGLW